MSENAPSDAVHVRSVGFNADTRLITVTFDWPERDGSAVADALLLAMREHRKVWFEFETGPEPQRPPKAEAVTIDGEVVSDRTERVGLPPLLPPPQAQAARKERW